MNFASVFMGKHFKVSNEVSKGQYDASTVKSLAYTLGTLELQA